MVVAPRGDVVAPHFLLYCVHTRHSCYKPLQRFTESCSSHVCARHQSVKASFASVYPTGLFLPWSNGEILPGYPNTPCPDELDGDYSGLISRLFNAQKSETLKSTNTETKHSLGVCLRATQASVSPKGSSGHGRSPPLLCR